MIKFNKENINKYLVRGASFALAITMIGSLAGCGKKKVALSESDVVAVVDGKQQILRAVYPEYCMDYCEGYKGWWEPSSYYPAHEHYQNLSNGEYLTTSTHCYTIVKQRGILFPVSPFDGPEEVRYVEDLEVEGSVVDYLTDDELKLMEAGNLAEEDFIEILSRIQSQPIEVNDEGEKTYRK